MHPLLSALLVPETESGTYATGKLLLFFNLLSYYLPTESDMAGSSVLNPFTGLCTGYVPVPLGEDLVRFNRLLQEMENSRPDDLARLFSSAQSPIATGQIRDREESSTGSVLSALHKDNGKKAYVQQKERLWQARLILKLAEMLDRREDEVRRGLAQITAAEQKVFASLGGISETEHENFKQDPELDKLAQVREKLKYQEDYSSGGSGALLSIRLKAWAELFLADTSPNRPFILVAGNSNCGNMILERYEKIMRTPPHKLFSLSLPLLADPGTSKSAYENFMASRKRLQLSAQDPLAYFENILKKAAVLQPPLSGKQAELNVEPRYVEDWDSKIKIEFPGPEKGCQKLDFYCFPGISPTSLLQRVFQLEPVSVSREQQYTTSLLATLSS